MEPDTAKPLTISWFRDPGNANGPYPVLPNEYDDDDTGISMFTNAEGDVELTVDNSTARNPNGKWDMVALHVETEALEDLNPPASGADKGLVTENFLENDSWDLSVEQVGGDKTLDIAANQEDYPEPELSAETEAEIPPVMVFADTEGIEGDYLSDDEPDSGLYVWIDPNRATLMEDGEETSFAPGESYEATFDVTGQTQSVAFDMVEGESRMDDDYAPANTFNREVVGETKAMTASTMSMVMVPEDGENQTATFEVEGNYQLGGDTSGTIPWGEAVGQFDFTGLEDQEFDVHMYAPGYLPNATLSSDFRDQDVLLESENRIHVASGSGSVRDVIDPNYVIENATIRDSKTMTIAYTNPDHDTPTGIATQIGDGHASGDSTIAYTTGVEDPYYDEMWLHYETTSEIFPAIDRSPGTNSVEKFQSSPLSLNVTQVNADDGSPLYLNLTRNASGVYVVPDNSSSDARIYNSSEMTGLFFSFKLNDMQFFEDGEAAMPQPGDAFEATLTIDTEEGTRTETTQWRFVEGRTVPIAEGDELRLQQSESATVQFNSTLARGTAMGIRVVATAENGTELLNTSTGEMTLSGMGPTICCDGPSTGPWGSISTTIDTSDLPVGTQIEAQARVVADLPDSYPEPLVVSEIDGEIRAPPSGSVSFSAQEGDGTSVTVDSVDTTDGGFVSVHSNSPTGPTLGVSDYFEAGEQSDIQISLDETIDETTTVYVLVHTDSDFNQEFNWPVSDPAYTNDDGSRVSASAEYTVPSTPTDTPSTPTDTPSTPTDTPSTPTDTATATATPTDTPDDGPETPGATTTTDGSSDGGPGFGIAIALVALLAAAALLTRRD
jgi:PGF-CTERM protein